MGFLSQSMQKPIMTITHQHICNQSSIDGTKATSEMSGKSNAPDIMDSAQHNKVNELTTVTNLQTRQANTFGICWIPYMTPHRAYARNMLNKLFYCNCLDAYFTHHQNTLVPFAVGPCEYLF